MTAVVSSAGTAQARADRIRAGVRTVMEWQQEVLAAWKERDWEALEYQSWDAYLSGEFGEHRVSLPPEQRREFVANMRAAGEMSTRAIASAANVSQMTVVRDLRTAGESNVSPAHSQPIVDRSTGEVLVDADEMAKLAYYDNVTEDEFEDALAAAREQDDLSHENVVANLPSRDSDRPLTQEECEALDGATPESQRVTGIDGKSYPKPKSAPRTPRKKPIGETAESVGWEIRKAIERLERLVGDDRIAANEKQVSLALRGHLLYAAETVAAVLDQLSN